MTRTFYGKGLDALLHEQRCQAETQLGSQYTRAADWWEPR